MKVLAKVERASIEIKKVGAAAVDRTPVAEVSFAAIQAGRVLADSHAHHLCAELRVVRTADEDLRPLGLETCTFVRHDSETPAPRGGAPLPLHDFGHVVFRR